MEKKLIEVLQALPKDEVAQIAIQVAKETLSLGETLGDMTGKGIDKVFDKLLTIKNAKR